jgi:hypothetical protein
MDQRTPQSLQQAQTQTEELTSAAKRPYEAPQVMVMNETEVLKVFQITSAGVSWWG